MISIRLTELEQLLSARLIATEDLSIEHISTDSRQIEHGALFIALIGEKFDAHDYIEVAKQQGAAALLVSKEVESTLPQLIVKDTKLALGQIGAYVKAQSKVKTVAITGSCGKTTVKEMLATMLSSQGKTLFTAGNFNNDIGVPLTLLRLEPSIEFAVIELGANHIGEIAYTTGLVKPDVALVTNLAAAHLEGFGSLAGVAKAKGEIFQGLAKDGIAIVNAESRADWVLPLKDKQVRVAGAQGDFYASDLQVQADGCYQFTLNTPKGAAAIKLSLPGKHNVTNSLVAVAAAQNISEISLNEIATALATVAPVKGRGAISFPRKGWRLIDDSYNASLLAMESAIDLLDSFPAQKMIVLADMAEMGEHSEKLHMELASYVKHSGIQTVVTYGVASKVISELNHGLHFTSQSALIEYVVELMNKQNEISVLVKGANGMKMSQVVKAIEEAALC